MIKVKAPSSGLDRKYFNRPNVQKALKKLGIGKCEKINNKTASGHLLKFLMLKEVECPLSNEDAEDFLEAVRAENKPVENTNKSNKELLELLK